MNKKKYSDEQIQHGLALRASGKRWKEIHRLLGTPNGFGQTCRVRAGLVRPENYRKGNRKYTDEFFLNVQAMRADGLPWRTITRQIGVREDKAFNPYQVWRRQRAHAQQVAA